MDYLGERAETAMNITGREAIRTHGEEEEKVKMKELNQMLTKRLWTPVDGKKLTSDLRCRIIRSSMFLKEKYLTSIRGVRVAQGKAGGRRRPAREGHA
jgi:hypothetical protein